MVEFCVDQGVVDEVEPCEGDARKGVISVNCGAPVVNGIGGFTAERERCRAPSSCIVSRFPKDALPREERVREDDRPRVWVLSVPPFDGARGAMLRFLGRTVVQSEGGDSDI